MCMYEIILISLSDLTVSVSVYVLVGYVDSHIVRVLCIIY